MSSNCSGWFCPEGGSVAFNPPLTAVAGFVLRAAVSRLILYFSLTQKYSVFVCVSHMTLAEQHVKSSSDQK
jgi:hypothetical protein